MAGGHVIIPCRATELHKGLEFTGCYPRDDVLLPENGVEGDGEGRDCVLPLAIKDRASFDRMDGTHLQETSGRSQ